MSDHQQQQQQHEQQHEQQQQQQQQHEQQVQERISQSRRNCYEMLQDLSIPLRTSSSSSSRWRQRQSQSQQQPLQIPPDIYVHILEYLPQFPLHHTKRGCPKSNSRKCQVTDQSCQTDAEGMIHARSHQPLPHLQFFKFRSIGFKVGFGVTTNPNGTGGIRPCSESCGFFVSTNCFHFAIGETENVANLMDWLLRTRYHSTDNTMGLAVDYAQNQLLLNWPNRQETLRLDLPPQFQNKLLYPMVQVWGGSAITVLQDKIMAVAADDTPSSLAEDSRTKKATSTTNTNTNNNHATTMENSNTTTTATAAAVTLNPPTTLSLTQSIAQDSWCSEWMSLCKSRGLPWDQQNPKRWTSSRAAPMERLHTSIITTSATASSTSATAAILESRYQPHQQSTTSTPFPPPLRVPSSVRGPKSPNYILRKQSTSTNHHWHSFPIIIDELEMNWMDSIIVDELEMDWIDLCWR